MVRFIDDHRDQYGVEPVCATVPIAPSTYFLQKARAVDPTRRSARAQRDDTRRVEIQRVWEAEQRVYGPRKVWLQLGREGVHMARCTVRRLMKELGLAGAVRGRAWVTTTDASRDVVRSPDLVERQFTATRPNQLWVSDFTYVATWRGFVYVAFVIDVFARRIVGWRVSHSMRTDLVLDALECATVAPPRAPASCITATAAPRVDSTGRRNASPVRSCDGNTETSSITSCGTSSDAVAGSSHGGTP
jgi:putative transposase